MSKPKKSKTPVGAATACSACWKCNEHAKLCGNCWHACQPFDVPSLGDHVHCNHPVIEARDSPPYNHGWGTLRDARETCPHWIPRQNV